VDTTRATLPHLDFADAVRASTSLLHLEVACWSGRDMGEWFAAIGANTSIRHLRIANPRDAEWDRLWECVARNSSVERLDVEDPPRISGTESGRRVVADAIRSNVVIKTLNVSGFPTHTVLPYLALNRFRPRVRALSNPGDGSEGDSPLSRFVAILRRDHDRSMSHPMCRFHLLRTNVSLLVALSSRRDSPSPQPRAMKKHRGSF
jgi:hypothetical protein